MKSLRSAVSLVCVLGMLVSASFAQQPPQTLADVYIVQGQGNIAETLVLTSVAGGVYRVSVSTGQVRPPNNCTGSFCGIASIAIDWHDVAGTHEYNNGFAYSDCATCMPLDFVKIMRLSPGSSIYYNLTDTSQQGAYNISLVAELIGN